MLKLKLQYFGHLMQRTDAFEKTLMLGKTEGRRRRDDRGWDGWMASLIQWTWVWVDSGSWWWTGRPGVLQSIGSQRVGHDWETELNWTKWALCLVSAFGLKSILTDTNIGIPDLFWLPFSWKNLFLIFHFWSKYVFKGEMRLL